MGSWGVLLPSRMRTTWRLIFFLSRAQPPPPTVLLCLSWDMHPREGTSVVSPWGPIHLLPQI